MGNNKKKYQKNTGNNGRGGGGNYKNNNYKKNNNGTGNKNSAKTTEPKPGTPQYKFLPKGDKDPTYHPFEDTLSYIKNKFQTTGKYNDCPGHSIGRNAEHGSL